MSVHAWIIFASACFFLSMTPGPNMLLALSHGVRYGPGRTVGTMVGICLALALLTTLAATGVGAVFAASATAFRILCLAGAGYLVFMGIMAWRAPPLSMQPVDRVALHGRGSPVRLATQGFLVAISNPKGLAFFVAFLPQFINRDLPLFPQIGLMSVCILIVEAFWISVYATAGACLLRLLIEKGGERLLNRISGVLLIGAAVLLMFF